METLANYGMRVTEVTHLAQNANRTSPRHFIVEEEDKVK